MIVESKDAQFIVEKFGAYSMPVCHMIGYEKIPEEFSELEKKFMQDHNIEEDNYVMAAYLILCLYAMWNGIKSLFLKTIRRDIAEKYPKWKDMYESRY